MGLPLYHISNDIDNIIEEFEPRIPLDPTFLEENKTIPRICVSLSLSGAITGKPKNSSEKILGEIYRVYEFDVDYPDNPNIIDYRTLYENELVIDSILTKEYWITEKIKPIKTYLIKITKISQELVPVIKYSKIKDYLDKLEKDPDNSDQWLEENGGMLQVGFDKLQWINLDNNMPGADYNMINSFWAYKNK